MEAVMTEQLTNRVLDSELAVGARGVAALVTLPQGTHGRGFTDHTLSPERGLAIDPFLVLSDFEMPQPFFPPHPHAGFSVMTYMFPDSVGAFINRDSMGDHSRIEPGALHWTQAARGIQHEEVPEIPGQRCHGLQMWVNLAAEHKLADPRVAHVHAADVPELRPSPGVLLRVVAGAYDDVRASYETLTVFTLLDVYLEPGGVLTHRLSAADNAFLMAIDGAGATLSEGGTSEIGEHTVALFDHRGELLRVQANDQPFHFLLAHGRPLAEPVVFGGPFVMNTHEQITAARARFACGEMGRLEPSVDFDR
jgi:redox-sensitive bicupin YhaK (pirin superfamily)